MTELALAALVLPLSHFGISSTSLRDALVRRVGEPGYLGLYSLVTVVAFAWLVAAYRHAPSAPLWYAPAGVKLLVDLLVLLAFLLVVVGVATPNPSAVGAEALLDRPDVARGILRITRNPFLWGVGLWALAHIVATGDLSDVLLFASVGSLGWVGSFLIDAKKARRLGERWRRFADATSNVPFAAVAGGRQTLGPGVLKEIGLWRVALATAIFVVVLLAHRRLFGVNPLPTW
jgi:uncharacterized membrane protein